jgi:hypothetical protein
MARKRTSAEDDWDDSDGRNEPWSERSRASGQDASESDEDELDEDELDEDELDEDEHDALDRARFDSDTAFCPECGAEIYDAADVCPKCFTWIDGETQGRPRSRRRQTIRQTIVWVLIVTLLAGAGVFSLVQLL